MKLIRCLPVVCLLPVFLAGCNRNDTDRLAKIGNILVDRMEDSANEFQNRYLENVPVKETISNWRLASRVRRRLRSDKALVHLSLEVKAKGTIVELNGQIENLRQRQRAVELANSTVGVETVRDQLRLGNAEGPAKAPTGQQFNMHPPLGQVRGGDTSAKLKTTSD
ncbi:MAG: BON domain-containing protein [Gemmataceae bacterium]